MKSSIKLLLLMLPLFVVSAGCLHRPQNFYFGHYSEAEKFYSKGDYEKAIANYQAYRDENPEGNLAVIAEYYMAKSYQALGKNDEARMHYEEIRKSHPDLVWANFSEAQLKELSSPAETPAAEK